MERGLAGHTARAGAETSEGHDDGDGDGASLNVDQLLVSRPRSLVDVPPADFPLGRVAGAVLVLLLVSLATTVAVGRSGEGTLRSVSAGPVPASASPAPPPVVPGPSAPASAAPAAALRQVPQRTSGPVTATASAPASVRPSTATAGSAAAIKASTQAWLAAGGAAVLKDLDQARDALIAESERLDPVVLAAACRSLEQVVEAGVALGPLPDARAETAWRASLNTAGQAAAFCLMGVEQNDPDALAQAREAALVSAEQARLATDRLRELLEA